MTSLSMVWIKNSFKRNYFGNLVPKEHEYLSALRNLALGRPEGQADKHVTGLCPWQKHAWIPVLQRPGCSQEFAYLSGVPQT